MNFKEQYIIFFDGKCNLCNNFVDYITKRDTNKLFTFSPLQEEIAQKLLEEKDIKDLESIVFWKKGNIFRASSALFEIMKLLYPRGVFVFKILPRSFYKFFYHIIAKNRYKLFGKRK